ncbi:hypothetical protein LCGC14_1335600 [marine sediment metagenome]|uniref:Uncharacterized protein n=1 Tax=marine sediment metagenome TaxID=412755 RepID=A0A0F9MW91_9ZZZZ
MIKKIIQELKIEWKKNKVTTGFMGVILGISILSYLKPASTSGILNYIGLSIVNFVILSLIIIGIWWLYLRKKIKW